eukprot:3510949-Amphidinium_carterae.1
MRSLQSGLHLVKFCLSLVEPIANEDLVFHNGTLLAAGAFGVVKPSKFIHTDTGAQLPVLRLIINMVPQNAVQTMIEDGLQSLPYMHLWQSIELDTDEHM